MNAVLNSVIYSVSGAQKRVVENMANLERSFMITELSSPLERGNKRIEVNEAWALRYWTQELGVTEKDLRETVEVVGPMLFDVKKILAR